MSTETLREIAEEFAVESLQFEELGLEGRISLNFMGVKFGEIIRNFSRYVKEKTDLKKEIDASVMRPVDRSQKRRVEKIFKVTPYTSLQNFTIRVPEAVSGQMRPYTQALVVGLEGLTTVEKRLIDPLTRWCADALSSESGPRQYIIAKKGAPEAPYLKESLEVLREHYDEKASSDLTYAKTLTVYPTEKSLYETGDNIDKLAALTTKVASMRLAEKTAECASLVQRVVDENDRDNILEHLPRHTIHNLAQMVYQAAHEVEAIALMVHQARAAGVAYNETLTKIVDEVK